MKVLFVATVMSHLKAFHLPYMQWFQEQGWEVHCIANDDYDLQNCAHAHIMSIARSPISFANLRAYSQLRTLLAQEHFDIIHCHTPMGGVIARLAAKEARKKGTKVIYTAHGLHFYNGAPLINWLLFYPLERLLARYTDVLITINREDFIRTQKFSSRRVEYVPGVGVDVKRFSQTLDYRENARRALGIQSDVDIILSVGEINRNKNHIVVLRAMAQMKREKKIGRMSYLLCGAGPLQDRLKQEARSLGIDDMVNFLGYRTDMELIYAACDIFVFPSLREGLPVSLIEAMANGLPVICSRIRGNTDLIVAEQGGFLFDPRDVGELKGKIERMLGDERLRKDFGEYNRKASQLYDLHNAMEKTTAIYRSQVRLCHESTAFAQK